MGFDQSERTQGPIYILKKYIIYKCISLGYIGLNLENKLTSGTLGDTEISVFVKYNNTHFITHLEIKNTLKRKF